MHRRPLPAYRVFLILSAIQAFANTTMFTLLAVYKVQVVHLDALQLVLVGTVLEASYFLFQVPTGVIADTFSRRVAVIGGMFAIAAGWLLEGSVPTFAAILLGEVIIGAGEAALTGATEAWIADEVGTAQVGTVFLRGSQIGQAAAVIATVASVGLASIALNLPLLVGGVIYLGLGGFLVLVMPETAFRPTPPEEQTTWQAMRATLTAGVRVVRGRPVLLAALGLSAIQGVAGEGYDRLWEAHLLTDFHLPALGPLPPIAWFGIINIVGMVLSIAGTEGLRRRIDTNRQRSVLRLLVVFQVLQIAGIALFALAGSFPLALLALWATGTVGSLIGPLNQTWITQSIDSRVRATVLSFAGQANAIAQVAGGPPVGALGKAVSLSAALAVTGLLRIPAVLIYARLLRRALPAAPLAGEELPELAILKESA